MIEKDQTKAFTIVLGMKNYEDLTDRAMAHGKTPAELAAWIIIKDIENNLGLIDYLRIRADRDL